MQFFGDILLSGMYRKLLQVADLRQWLLLLLAFINHDDMRT